VWHSYSLVTGDDKRARFCKMNCFLSLLDSAPEQQSSDHIAQKFQEIPRSEALSSIDHFLFLLSEEKECYVNCFHQE
jgi:hypothetical protein